MAEPDYLHDDVEKIFQHERENRLREAGRFEGQRNSAEVTLLDGAETQEEYKRRRAAAPGLIVEADAPLGEVSFRDFKIRREQEHKAPAPELTEGMSFQDYKKARERK